MVVWKRAARVLQDRQVGDMGEALVWPSNCASVCTSGWVVDQVLFRGVSRAFRSVMVGVWTPV
jgi:hypothetical protein